MRQYENLRLDKWRKAYDQEQGNFDELNGYVTACVEKGGLFQQCLQDGQNTYPPEAKSPVSWAAGKISELASDALQEAARYIGKAVVWLLEEFAKIFNSSSTIDLSRTGIDSATGVMTTLSLVIATFLLLLQFGKVAVSQRGEPAATAVIGLAKWGVVSSVYVLATQTALSWSDAVSTWIINYTFEGGGSGEADATEAMQHQLGTLFGGLITGGGGAATVGTALITGEGVAAAAVGVIIVVGIVCILAIAALWLEVLLRQAGIMILVATMPVVLAGQLSDSTQEWWPKARNALIALILMKPMIVLCFAIGFGAMAEGQGVQNMFVGLVIFILACFAWPVLAKFMTFSTVGGGSAIASGLMSSVGSSAASAAAWLPPRDGRGLPRSAEAAPTHGPWNRRRPRRLRAVPTRPRYPEVARAEVLRAVPGGPSARRSSARSPCLFSFWQRARTPSSPAWRAPPGTRDSTTERQGAATSSSPSAVRPPRRRIHPEPDRKARQLSQPAPVQPPPPALPPRDDP